MRRFALLTVVGTLIAIAIGARAQEVDLAVGASTLFSSKQTTASQAFLPPPEKGGVYPSASLQILFKNRFGVNGEFAVRSSKGLYNGYQYFRPMLYDFNAVFAPKVKEGFGVDLMAGVGGQSLIFYTQTAGCGFNFCTPQVNSTHLLAHAGADVRAYFWRNFFLRPEVHYYRVINNDQFHSDNLFRAGASIGYTFGRE